jgi:GNAT superfamily N-acetyltransferase
MLPKNRVPTTQNSTTVRAVRLFGSHYREEVILRDGTAIFLKTLQPEDKEGVRTGFERMSRESRFKRFFAYKASLSSRELSYLTDLDGETHFALAAGRILPGGAPEGIGTARFICLGEDPGAAEFALTIVDDWQGKGIGKLLFHYLAQAARERHIDRLVCSVMPSNKPMSRILETYPGAKQRWEGEAIHFTIPLSTITH